MWEYENILNPWNGQKVSDLFQYFHCLLFLSHAGFLANPYIFSICQPYPYTWDLTSSVFLAIAKTKVITERDFRLYIRLKRMWQLVKTSEEDFGNRIKMWKKSYNKCMIPKVVYEIPKVVLCMGLRNHCPR